jgi:CheY-like chemotaxis protein
LTPSSRRKICIIDDNEDNRFIIRIYLENRHDVVEFSDGLRALAGMTECKPDLVFLDISLPDVDGVEVLRRIRADERLRQLPVVALTAHAMIGDRKRFIDLGFDAYLSKPILDIARICDIIDNLTRAEGKRDQTEEIPRSVSNPTK